MVLFSRISRFSNPRSLFPLQFMSIYCNAPTSCKLAKLMATRELPHLAKTAKEIMAYTVHVINTGHNEPCSILATDPFDYKLKPLTSMPQCSHLTVVMAWSYKIEMFSQIHVGRVANLTHLCHLPTHAGNQPLITRCQNDHQNLLVGSARPGRAQIMSKGCPRKWGNR